MKNNLTDQILKTKSRKQIQETISRSLTEGLYEEGITRDEIPEIIKAFDKIKIGELTYKLTKEDDEKAEEYEITATSRTKNIKAKIKLTYNQEVTEEWLPEDFLESFTCECNSQDFGDNFLGYSETDFQVQLFDALYALVNECFKVSKNIPDEFIEEFKAEYAEQAEQQKMKFDLEDQLDFLKKSMKKECYVGAYRPDFVENTLSRVVEITNNSIITLTNEYSIEQLISEISFGGTYNSITINNALDMEFSYSEFF